MLTLNSAIGAPGPDLSYPCSPGTLGSDLLFGAGVGSGDFVLPKGVAMRVPAGGQLLLNLHLFNAEADTLEGESGVLILRADPADVEVIAGAVLAGTQDIHIPPMSSATAEGQCVFPNDATVLSVLPHMHQLGRRVELIHDRDTGSVVLYEGDYAFTDQLHHLVEPRLVYAGDTVRVRCTYDNPTQQAVGFGESSNAEMCFAGLVVYPSLGAFFCGT